MYKTADDISCSTFVCRPDDEHCARTALICLENSHNRCGGSVLSLEYMNQVKALADAKVRIFACSIA